MRAFPAAFQAELARNGCNPYWLLKITVGAATYYLSDNDRYITAIPAQAYGVVKSLGAVRDGISGALDDFRVAEYSVVLVLGGMGPDLAYLADTGALDDARCDLYLGLGGIAEAPQLIQPGRIRDFGEITDTTITLTIQDLTIDLERFYVGKKATATDYPTIDPADVGKLLPICFGSAPKQPALALSMGARTTLKTAIATTGETTIYPSDLTGIALGDQIIVDAERMYVGVQSGGGLIVTRGYNGTTAAAHTQGAAVVKLQTLVYCVSWRAVTSIDKVWLRRNDLDLDITAYCTRYTGQAGNQLSGYGSMAMITLTTTQLAQILALANMSVSSTDTIATAAQDQYSTIDLDEYDFTGSIEYLPSIINGNLQEGSRMLAGSSVTLKKAKVVSAAGKPLYVRVCVKAGHATYSGYNYFKWYCNGSYVGQVQAGGTTPTVFRSGWLALASWLDLNASNSYVYSANAAGEPSVWVWEVWLEVTSNPAASSTSTEGVAKTGTVTVQLTGSVVSDYFGSGKVLADVTADAGTPAGMADWILSQAGLPASVTIGALTADQFGGRIDEYKTALWWLNYLAFQAGAWFMLRSGAPSLVSRQVSVASRTITACRASEDGRRDMSRTRTAVDDVIDKISVLYARDWTKSRGSDAYAGCTAVAGAGDRERPELFQFDLIRADILAAALRDLYSLLYGARRKVVRFGAWIDQADLESGDVVLLEFLGGAMGTVMPAEQVPGSMDSADSVELTILI